MIAMPDVLVDTPAELMRQHVMRLRSVPIAFDLAGCHCHWLGWGYNPDGCRDRGAHSHSFYEVCYVHQGRGFFELDGHVHDVRRGELFVSRPGQVHLIDTSQDDPMGIYFWYFTLSGGVRPRDDADATAALVRGFCDSTRTVARAPVSMVATLSAVVEEIAASAPGYARAVMALAQKLLVDTARSASDTLPQPPAAPMPPARVSDAIVRVAEQFMRDNYARPIGVADVADQVHVSPRHLARIFRDVTGRSVLQFLTATRVQAAQTMLLKQPTMPVKQIAGACGYADPRHFSEVFERQTGMSPAAYRKSHGVKAIRER